MTIRLQDFNNNPKNKEYFGKWYTVTITQVGKVVTVTRTYEDVAPGVESVVPATYELHDQSDGPGTKSLGKAFQVAFADAFGGINPQLTDAMYSNFNNDAVSIGILIGFRDVGNFTTTDPTGAASAGYQYVRDADGQLVYGYQNALLGSSPQLLTDSNLQLDAFKHAFTSAQFAQFGGASAAHTMVDWHDFVLTDKLFKPSSDYSSTQGLADHAMDIFNNDFAISNLGSQASSGNWTVADLAKAVSESILSEQLVTRPQFEYTLEGSRTYPLLNPLSLIFDVALITTPLGSFASQLVSGGVSSFSLIDEKGRGLLFHEGNSVLIGFNSLQNFFSSGFGDDEPSPILLQGKVEIWTNENDDKPSAIYVNENLPGAASILSDASRNGPTKGIFGTFGLDEFGTVHVTNQYTKGNALSKIELLTGLNATDLSHLNSSVLYQSATDTTQILGALTLDLRSLLNTSKGVKLITNSLSVSGIDASTGLLANLNGNATIDLGTGRLDIPSSLYLGKVVNGNPIGAFYESGSLGYDESLSVATLTSRLYHSGTSVSAEDISSLDTNGDGTIDSSDSNFGDLSVWQDLNENGTVEIGEMQTLVDLGVESIPLNEASKLALTAGNSYTVVEDDISALEASVPDAPSIDYGYYRNEFNQTRPDGTMWSSSEVKVTDDNQYVVGTSENDDLFFSDLSLRNVLGGDGNDEIRSSWRETTIFGGNGDDLIVSDFADDTLLGESGNDSIWAGAGDDTIYGGAGDDVLSGFYGVDANNVPVGKHRLGLDETDNDVILGGDGNDRIYGHVGNDTLFGDSGNDLILGFTPHNDPKRFLEAGESDNDIISGGAGNDTILGGTGNDAAYGDDGNDLIFGYDSPNDNNYLIPAGEVENDTLWGGAGSDQLQGQQGNDFLLGGTGDDLLFGQVGDDTLYGQDGNDVLVGFTGYNETKQSLTTNDIAQESDNDFLYGGDGEDTLIGGLGNDYLDGGASADSMEGGDGNDIYIVNTINDVVLERENGGTDSVLSAVNYLLNSEVENLYLLGNGDINGSGNKRNNEIQGTAGANILDGVTGADTMVGYGGDDVYYVDNVGDVVVEKANEGDDTVNSSISWTLGSNQENLTLISYSIPERGLIDGQDVLVYGYPKRYELDYNQGDKDPQYRGTCALVAISNLITQAQGIYANDVTEEEVVQAALTNPGGSLITTGLTVFANGGSTPEGQQELLADLGYANTLSFGLNLVDAAAKIKSGQGVLLGVNAGRLWDDESYIGDGDRNHAITLTGVVYDSTGSEIIGFYIADSGRGMVSDMTRYLSYADLYDAANMPGAYMIYTNNFIKLWDVNIDGTGNSLDNTIIGTEGNNSLNGGAGTDSLVGGKGNDTYVVDNVNDLVFENVNEGTDTVQSSISYSIVDNIENLTLTGAAAINGTGNGGNNVLTGNSAANILDGGAGNDTMSGGLGDDTYVVDSTNDVINESSGQGTDTVQASFNYTLSSNLENLTLTGNTVISGTGNSLNNVLTNLGSTSNTLSGGLGDDTYVLQDGATVVVENAAQGTDTVVTSASYTLANNLENLTLTGSSALAGTGNTLNNFIIGNNAASTLSGGTGNDTYEISNAGTVIVENSSSGTDSVSSSVTYTLSANVENLTLTGSGSTSAYGNTLANVITGNAYNNTLDGMTGADTLIGGGGNDTYYVDNAGDSVVENSSEGTDKVYTNVSHTLSANVEQIVLTGAANITGTGNSLDNTLSSTNTGSSTLAGGAGNDYYVLDGGVLPTIVENLNEGTDTVAVYGNYTLTSNVENLTVLTSTGVTGTGNSLNNSLMGGTGNDTLIGGAGNDVIQGGGTLNSGIDSMVGGTGDDSYIVDEVGDIILENANEGIDTVTSLYSYTLSDNIENLVLTYVFASNGTGNAQDNYIQGNGNYSLLTGLGGNDTLDGGGGIDTLVGGLGNDTYVVRSVSDVVTENASEGTDTVTSYVNFTLSANLENLSLLGSSDLTGTGNSGVNVIIGNSGNNTLNGGGGNDTMSGGLGNDLYYVDNSGDLISENSNEGIDSVASSVTWTLGSNFEKLYITGASQIGTGTSGNDTLVAQANNVKLLGGNGNDALYGGTETFGGASISATLEGGAGNDTYSINYDTGTVITEGSSAGTDTVYSWSSYTLGSNLENLVLEEHVGSQGVNGIGNTLDNQIVGNSSSNSLTGGDGNDTLDGGSGGTDTLVGGNGNDIYVVNDSSDVITETASGGVDTVIASYSYSLSSRLENLTLSGSADINGTGNSGDNIMVGNSGANILDGGNGNDAYFGGAGNDYYIVGSAGDTVTESANEGIDTVESSLNYTLGSNVENLILTSSSLSGTGNSLNNSITAASGSNILLGGLGNDTLDGGAGGDSLNGGDGDDVYVVDSASDTVTDSSGTDTIKSSITFSLTSVTGIENLTLIGSSNINGTGNSGNNVLTGNSGNNSLDAGAGLDTYAGGAGNDTYLLDSVNEVVIEDLGAGTDTIQIGYSYSLESAANVENLVLTGSATTGTGNGLNNTITGNSAANTIDGGLGADTMIGGGGNDFYYVNDVGDVVTEAASAGEDTVQSSISFTLGANIENLIVIGNSNSTLVGNTLANRLTGNSGNNILDATAGSATSTLTGGLGNDTYRIDGDVIVELIDEGIDTVESSETYTLGDNLENLTLTAAADGTGNQLDNYITGESHANILRGLEGNDTLDGGGGTDDLYGGKGNDTYIVSSATADVMELENEGIDTVLSSTDHTLSANVENLTLSGTSAIDGTGNELDNIITGNTGANVISGGAGADTMIGGGGNDTYIVDDVDDVVIDITGTGSTFTDTIESSVTYYLDSAANVERLTLTGGNSNISGAGNSLDNILTGNSGNNFLSGGAGNDSVTGGSGDDTIDGGTGADTMIGGTGNDSYYVDNVGDVVTDTNGDGSDTVYSSISYTLGTFTESLILIGDQDITATGTQYDNYLVGNVGNNTLDGGNGSDTISGGLGNDTYILDHNDVVREFVGGGVDTVQIGSDYTLGDNFENLVLTGAGHRTGTGNGLDNYLTGNTGNNSLTGAAGNDTLEGGAGLDTLVGGTGDDVYIIDSSDTLTEGSNEGIDEVRAGFGYTLGANFENLTLTGTAAIAGTGNSADNKLIGNSGANTLTGADGNDTLDGGDGVDSLAGGAGDDVYILTHNVNDTITEVSGTDTVQSAFTYTLASGLENLTLLGTSAINGTGNSAANVLIGNSGSNSLTGADGNDTISSGDGNDTLDGGIGNDSLTGGLGNDTYVVDSSSDVVVELTGEGIDTVSSSVAYTLGADLENLTLTGASNINGVGNGQNNVLTGNTGNNSLTGGAGDDTLSGGAGIDTMVGGLGNDEYTIDSTSDVVTENSEEGVDTVKSSVTYTLGSNLENLTLLGSSSVNGTGNSLANSIIGNTGSNSLSGGDGNDTLDGGTGLDTLVGGLGDDVYFIEGSSTDTVTEASGQGVDTVNSSMSSYTLAANVENLNLIGSASSGTGNALDNVITGNSSNNTLSGGDGNDTLDGMGGNDSLVGGLGNDVYYVGNGTDTVTESASGGTDTVYSTVNWTLGSEVENLILTGAATNGTGNSSNNSIVGNELNNSLSGGSGNDTLDGGIGNDSLVGGTGNDVFFVDSAGDVVTENASEGTDLVNSTVSLTLSANVENLTLSGDAAINGAGNASANVITGNDASNILYGDAGNDSLVGGAGFDTIDGGAGNDTMLGGVGNDTYFVDVVGDAITENSDEGIDTVNSMISYTLGSNLENLTLLGAITDHLSGTGNSLDNRILGNGGNNSLSGGAGNDTLSGEAGADTMLGGTGDDVYFVDDALDSLTENASEGIDTVNSEINWTLSSNFENLTLTGFEGLVGTGNSLANMIIGGEGNDTISGGDGNDTIDGGIGNDSLTGGLGDDTFLIDSSSDSISENASEGTDTAVSTVSYTLLSDVENLMLAGTDNLDGTGNSSANTIAGNSGMNSLVGAAGNDTIYGQEGDDTLDGGTGNDSLVGGEGNDLYVVDSSTDLISESASEGLDIVYSSVTWSLGTNSNVENLRLLGTSNLSGTGNELDNLIEGNSGNNTLTGGDGNDTLFGGLGADSLLGGLGDDVYFVDNVGDTVSESTGQGTDTIVSSRSFDLTSYANVENLTLSGYGTEDLNGIGNSSANTITGDRGNNSLSGADGDDSLIGGIGNDTLNGGSGNDTMEGGVGNDLYYVDSSGDVVIEEGYLNGTTDTVSSSVDYALGNYVENLTLTGAATDGYGNSWDNVITGNSNDNWLAGGFGNDTLTGGGGNDTLVGGRGDDTYYLNTIIDQTIVELEGEGTDTVVWTGTSYTTINLGESPLENLTLQGTATNLNGNSFANVIIGNGSANTISGGGGNDTLDGGTGGSIVDSLLGGVGDDTYIISYNTSDVITELDGEGTDTVKSAFSYTLGSYVENLTLTGSNAINGTGNSLDNVLTGNSAANSLTGGAGNDTYMAGFNGGSDTVSDSGGSFDKISFETNVDENDVVFFMSGSDLQIGFLGDSGQVTVLNNTLERFELSDGQFLTSSDVNLLIQQMSSYAASHSLSFTSLNNVKGNSELMNIIASSWHTA